MNTEKKSNSLDYKLKQIYFYVTKGCNLRCRHCWVEPKYQNNNVSKAEISTDLFASIIEQPIPLGLTRIKLTGGEPLLHSKISDLIYIIHNFNLELTVETNGLLCTPDVANQITRCKKSFVSVSLDGSTEDVNDSIRGVKGSFKKTLNGIKSLVDAGIQPQIIMTLMRKNSHQVESLIDLAKTVGAGSVKFNAVQPTARGEKMHKAGETLSIDELIRLGSHIETELIPSFDILIYPHHPPAFQPLSRLLGDWSKPAGVCGIRSIIGVLADGSYALCGIGETVSELVFGHAAVDPLNEIWHENQTIIELREGLPGKLEGVCSQCLMVSRCLGNCIAQNYYTNHSLWAPYWYCHQASEAGLFPETRKRPQKLYTTVE